MTQQTSHQVRVVNRDLHGTDVVALQLRGENALPGWTPGAHIDVVLPSGLVRQYSLCGPEQGDYLIAVLDQPDGRGGSREVHESLSLGTELTIIGPRNRFELLDAERYVFVAGGIGITPILPMIEKVAATGAPWTLLYGGRSRDSMAFLDRLDQWSEHVQVIPEDEQGRMDIAALLGPLVGAAVYTCGPPGLIDAVRGVVDAWPSGSFHFERFSGADTVLETTDNEAFEVQFGFDGPVVPVAENQTVLQAVLDAGADVLYSCEEGSCGSCETTVLEGDVVHRDSLLTPDERAAGSMLICVSRASCPRLVLDIPPP
ncbi:PDR/VanB family oxidoreductase [Rhodococcus sp. NPDC057529]|uniref:PDR/VanB family oxidoreductase n=1 Tax=Rhodococcus sp. NPDC057529 TaxID=3346158 RepID=UPI00366E8868